MNNSDDFNEQFTLFNDIKFEERKENDVKPPHINQNQDSHQICNNQNDSLVELEQNLGHELLKSRENFFSSGKKISSDS